MADNSIHIADQGHHWLGVRYESADGQTFVDGGQAYAEYQVPAGTSGRLPVVLIHGGGGQGTDWKQTPDGRPGWATLLLQRGYPVYIVDRPGHGRAGRLPSPPAAAPRPGAPRLSPSAEMLGALFAGRDNPLHTQWPGKGDEGDDALREFLASQSRVSLDMARDHQLMAQCGAELLDKTGPAVIITNSAGAPSGWLMADARPELVKAVVALEPFGPGVARMPWGLACAPITFDPSAPGAEDLKLIQASQQTSPLGQGGWMQEEPARRLSNLAGIPIAVVTAEQSPAGGGDAGTVAFLRQAGCTGAEHLALSELGIHGNGHLMMLELNNSDILDAVTAWLERNLPSPDRPVPGRDH